MPNDSTSPFACTSRRFASTALLAIGASRETAAAVIRETAVRNKIDLTGQAPVLNQNGQDADIALSAKTGQGMQLLRDHLKQSMGYRGSQEGKFIARRRHLDALNKASKHLLTGKRALLEDGSGELLAEDLRQAQQSLSEITGEFSSDDLLGRIFSSFCIGK